MMIQEKGISGELQEDDINEEDDEFEKLKWVGWCSFRFVLKY